MVAAQEVRRPAVDVSPSPQLAEFIGVASCYTGEELVAAILGHDGRRGHRNVDRFSVIESLELWVLTLQGAEDVHTVRHDARGGRHLRDQGTRGPALQLVEQTASRVEVDLRVIEHGDRNGFREALDACGQLGALRPRPGPRAEGLGVAHAGARQRCGPLGPERHGGHDQRAQDGTAAGLVDPEDEGLDSGGAHAALRYRLAAAPSTSLVGAARPRHRRGAGASRSRDGHPCLHRERDAVVVLVVAEGLLEIADEGLADRRP